MRRYTRRMKRNTNPSASAIARCKFPFAPVPLLQILTKLTARYVLALTHVVSEKQIYTEILHRTLKRISLLRSWRNLDPHADLEPPLVYNQARNAVAN